MDDVRWFAPNRYTTLLADELRRQGLSIALEGTAPARVALAMSATTAGPAWRYARRIGCPLVLYIWDLPPKSTGTGSYDPVWSIAGALIRFPRPFGGFRRRRGYYSRLRYIAARAQEIWAPSGMAVDLIRLRFRLQPKKVPYCYDSTRFIPNQQSRDSPPVLLTVGRLKAHKNQEATLRAASRLGSRVQVLLIGRGPEAPNLERVARTLGVRCRIETGAGDAAVAEAYRRARVAVCPSRFEGFGLSPVEAIASGTPTVASDIPPHREFVGDAAHLVPLDDDVALAEAVLRAFDHRAPDADAVRALTIPAAAERFLSRLGPLLR